MDKIIEVVNKNNDKAELNPKVCHKFQPVVIPYQIQTVLGEIENKIDIKQINCYKEKCELWYVEEGMCAEKYNYIKNKEGEVM